MEHLNDESYMRLALQMAEQTRGQTGINPAVGCVIVQQGRIVGLGAHLKRGDKHAEIHALDMAGSNAAGSTVYVTLEPCSHYGRTPPCSDRLIREQVKRVVIAADDPNPLVSGSGIKRLRDNGIEVTIGVLEEESRKLNESFEFFIKTKRPFVTLKTASTLDGKIAASSGGGRITGSAAREFVHVLRHRHQAIMVGVGTVLADNPRLTTRLGVPGQNPLRVVIDSSLRTPLDAYVASDGEAPTLFAAVEGVSEDKIARLRAAGHEVMLCGTGPRVDLEEVMKRLAEREIASILLEGGGRLNGSMLERGLVNKLVLFFAPKIIGGQSSPGSFQFAGFESMEDAIRIKDVTLERYEEDFCLTGYPEYANGKGEI